MKKSLLIVFLLSSATTACTYITSTIKGPKPLEYEIPEQSNIFYADKLKCETTYTQYSFFRGKENGSINQEGPAKDCMLSKGYKLVSQ